jgi:hypothetical protein
MSIKVADEQAEERIEVKDPEVEVVPHGKLLADRIGQELFDLRPNELARYDSKINTLIDYAKMKTDDHSPEGLKWALRTLGLKLGTPPMGEKVIDYLTRYAYLDLESRKIELEKEKFYGNRH